MYRETNFQYVIYVVYYILEIFRDFIQVGLNLSFRLIWNVGCDRDHRVTNARRGFDGHEVHAIKISTRVKKTHLSELITAVYRDGSMIKSQPHDHDLTFIKRRIISIESRAIAIVDLMRRFIGRSTITFVFLRTVLRDVKNCSRSVSKFSLCRTPIRVSFVREHS